MDGERKFGTSEMCIHLTSISAEQMASERLAGVDLTPKAVGYYTMYVPDREIPGDRIGNVVILGYVVGKQLSGISRWERGEDQVVDKVVLEGLKKLNENGVYLTSGLDDRVRYRVE
jgi:hypothetical protein